MAVAGSVAVGVAVVAVAAQVVGVDGDADVVAVAGAGVSLGECDDGSEGEDELGNHGYLKGKGVRECADTSEACRVR